MSVRSLLPSFRSSVPSVTLYNLSEYLEPILQYHDQFKVFATPFEDPYVEVPDIEMVDRIYDAAIEDEDIEDEDIEDEDIEDEDSIEDEDEQIGGDSLYNVSFRFVGADGVQYYAYAHLRINYGYCIEDEFLRGPMFVTKFPSLFFMCTMPSIEETDDLHDFLREDGINLCFDQQNLPAAARAAIGHYMYQINSL